MHLVSSSGHELVLLGSLYKDWSDIAHYVADNTARRISERRKELTSGVPTLVDMSLHKLPDTADIEEIKNWPDHLRDRLPYPMIRRIALCSEEKLDIDQWYVYEWR